MVSSGCEVLLNEPHRFVDYIFADPELRKKIVDKKSFNAVLEKVLMSDTTLANIPREIKNKGESIEMCGVSIFNEPAIQDIIKRNVRGKTRELSRRVSKEKPNWTKKQKLKETTRRLNIFITGSEQKIKQTKQVTISEAMQPVRVKEYKRGTQTVGEYRKTKYKSLTQQEKMLLENAIRKGKKPSEIEKDYLQAGLGFRSPVSLKRHYYRLKAQIRP